MKCQNRQNWANDDRNHNLFFLRQGKVSSVWKRTIRDLSFWCDRNVVYLDCCVVYTSIYIYQTLSKCKLKDLCLTICKLYFIKLILKNYTIYFYKLSISLVRLENKQIGIYKKNSIGKFELRNFFRKVCVCVDMGT